MSLKLINALSQFARAFMRFIWLFLPGIVAGWFASALTHDTVTTVLVVWIGWMLVVFLLCYDIETKAMTNIQAFFELNLSIWSHNPQWIDRACEKLGQRGYMACPWFDISDSIPVWHFRHVELSRQQDNR